jgi:putative colanic acid biosynthesis glycosyltransferase WcaI
MKILLLNQCFWPDVVATAQQLTDLARGLADRGHEVTVITGRRGYDDPELCFPQHERWHNIRIVRVRAITGRKTSRWGRALNFASFLLACAWRLAITDRHDVVIALTSPPLISWLASWFARLKGGQFVFWVMDLNPDEAIAAGWLRPGSFAAKFLARLLETSLRHAQKIIVLDRFMKARVELKGVDAKRIHVISPWSQDDLIRFDRPGREAFRRVHGLSEKFVVMYAGNHSPCHPLDTLLEAAGMFDGRKDVAFCFVGGGSELRKVKEFALSRNLKNIRCLPYQPQEELAALLSAADLHLIVMGNSFPGIVHPCKIYNILTIGTPLLYLGPEESHVTDIIESLAAPERAVQARHGQPELITQLISNLAQGFVAGSSNTGSSNLAAVFAKSALLPKFIAEVEALGPEVGANSPETAAAKFQSA